MTACENCETLQCLRRLRARSACAVKRQGFETDWRLKCRAESFIPCILKNFRVSGSDLGPPRFLGDVGGWLHGAYCQVVAFPVFLSPVPVDYLGGNVCRVVLNLGHDIVLLSY